MRASKDITLLTLSTLTMNLDMGFNAVVEVQTSKELRVCGAIGHVTSLNKKTPGVSADTVRGIEYEQPSITRAHSHSLSPPRKSALAALAPGRSVHLILRRALEFTLKSSTNTPPRSQLARKVSCSSSRTIRTLAANASFA